jgi:hypothetical protein
MVAMTSTVGTVNAVLTVAKDPHELVLERQEQRSSLFENRTARRAEQKSQWNISRK